MSFERKISSLTVLICEVLVIFFNAGSYFNTTTYAKPIDLLGIFLAVFLLFWIWLNCRVYGYGWVDLGFSVRFVSRRQ
ncbi:MAG: hypothetical protein NDF54_02660 [archaeon GB-1867-035]|nr:hypothetical protein [Candidatus Culexmicrobium profundum]